MTHDEMRRRILGDLDEARADVIREHRNDLDYHEGFRDALAYVASNYLGIPPAVLGDNPSWQDDADAGRDWDSTGDEIADAYLEECALSLPLRLAALSD